MFSIAKAKNGQCRNIIVLAPWCVVVCVRVNACCAFVSFPLSTPLYVREPYYNQRRRQETALISVTASFSPPRWACLPTCIFHLSAGPKCRLAY